MFDNLLNYGPALLVDRERVLKVDRERDLDIVETA
jgi:hypothetical protein